MGELVSPSVRRKVLQGFLEYLERQGVDAEDRLFMENWGNKYLKSIKEASD